MYKKFNYHPLHVVNPLLFFSPLGKVAGRAIYFIYILVVYEYQLYDIRPHIYCIS